MKKITTYLFVLVFGIGFSANAQYYLNEFNPAGENPGGLNTDDENPGDPSYTDIIGSSSTAPALTWSTNQSIPFPFNFNGSPVTQYKVSNSGVLTFNTGATAVPSFANDTLGTSAIPDNSVCIWGLQQGAGNDAITKKTFGNAPNRQHWIYFASFNSPGGAINSQQGNWTYWGIVLEESTDKIYIVDMRTFNTALDLTIGIQVNTDTTIQVAGAPNTNSFVTNGGNDSDPSDNVYYEFIQGVRPANDLAISSVDEVVSAADGSSVTISGSFLNNGANPVDSVYVSWSDDGGMTVNRELFTGFNLATTESSNFVHSTTITASNPGTFTDVDVWVEFPSSKVDGNTANDSTSIQFFVNTGNSVTRNVLLEEFTTVPCGWCPGASLAADYILANVSNTILVGLHACFGSDAMTVTEATTLCSDIGPGSAPSGMVDRVLFNGEAQPGFSGINGFPVANNIWSTRAQTRSGVGAPVGIEIEGDYNLQTRTIDVDVKSSFVDYPVPGDIRVSLMIVEDSVTGSGSGYDQRNFYSGRAGFNAHPFFSEPDPLVGFTHRHVLRDILPSTYGDQSVIPSTVTLNTSYDRTFSYTLPSGFDNEQIYLVAVVSYRGTSADGYEVLNAKEVSLNTIVGISENSTTKKASVEIYPNPSKNIANISIDMEETSNVQMDIMDITGKVLSSENLGTKAKGNQLIQLNVANFADGFYFLNLKVGDEIVTRKFTVAK